MSRAADTDKSGGINLRDRLERWGNSLIQHGKVSERIYLLKLAQEDVPAILPALDDLCREKGYTKIFAQVPAWGKEDFEGRGYAVEAHIPGFYRREEDAFFMGKFFSPERRQPRQEELLAQVLQAAKAAPVIDAMPRPPAGIRLEILSHQHAPALAEVYRQVFASYPFPIFDPEYLKKAMDEEVLYLGLWQGEKLAAAAACEMNRGAQNVEMTDFATLPEYRGQGFATLLLAYMEEEMAQQGIALAYTIARGVSYGMNITFGKHGYSHAGTLVNNTGISGSIESMNVWYKRLVK